MYKISSSSRKKWLNILGVCSGVWGYFLGRKVVAVGNLRGECPVFRQPRSLFILLLVQAELLLQLVLMVGVGWQRGSQAIFGGVKVVGRGFMTLGVWRLGAAVPLVMHVAFGWSRPFQLRRAVRTVLFDFGKVCKIYIVYLPLILTYKVSTSNIKCLK